MVRQVGITSAGRPRLLIVEPEFARLRQICGSLGRGCCSSRALRRDDGSGGEIVRCGCDHAAADSCCTCVGTVHRVHGANLHRVDVVICAVNLPDGSGLDVLEHVQRVRPGLPVILAGAVRDGALAAEAIRAGAMDFLVLADRDLLTFPLAIEKCLAHQRIKVENDRLQRELSRSLGELELKNEQFEALIQQLERKARTDELTGLANRRWLNLMLEGSWAEAERNRLPLAFLMIDLDRFKALNDRLGHQRGDDMLRMVGRILQANCRKVDVSARYGGDEFCVLMPHCPPREAVKVAERILREFDGAVSALPAAEPRVGMTIGISHNGLSGPASADQLVTHADEALYVGKSMGTNRIVARAADGVRAIDGSVTIPDDVASIPLPQRAT